MRYRETTGRHTEFQMNAAPIAGLLGSNFGGSIGDRTAPSLCSANVE